MKSAYKLSIYKSLNLKEYDNGLALINEIQKNLDMIQMFHGLN